jgi:dTDP-4-amino-4,6-dideoxygalactose transaminase
MFYLVCPSLAERISLIAHLKENGVFAIFHYVSLHSSDFYTSKHDGRELIKCDKFADCLVRLPMYYELGVEKIDFIINKIELLYE